MELSNLSNKIEECALGGKFGPTTKEIGYLKADAARVAEELKSWRDAILHPSEEKIKEVLESMEIELTDRVGTSVAAYQLNGSFESMVRALSPLSSLEKRRETVAQTLGDWSSYLNNKVHGTDCVPAIGHLSRSLGCDGVRVLAKKEESHIGKSWTHLHIDYFISEDTDWLNVKFTVDIKRKGRRGSLVEVTGEAPDALQNLTDTSFDANFELLVDQLERIGLKPFLQSFHCKDEKFWMIELEGDYLPGESEVEPDWM